MNEINDNLNKIIIALHGHYRGKDLDEFGQAQMALLGRAIKSQLNGDSLQIMSSTAPWAMQSAGILADMLGTISVGHDLLWSGRDGPLAPGLDPEGVFRLIQASRAETIILVTHSGYSEFLPRFLRQKIFGSASDFPSRGTGHGEAWVIYRRSGTYDLLRHGKPQ